MAPRIPLEFLFTHKDAFGVETATPLQRAICRVSDGVPLGDLWSVPDVQAGFGGVRPPEVAPRTMGVFCAVRGGKSSLAAAKVIAISQTCNLDHLSAGDIVEVPVLAPTKKRAAAMFSHIANNLKTKPLLRPMLACEPTQETITIRHPSGREIFVHVTPLSKHGTSVIGAWVAGAVFDEAPRMAGIDDGVRNLTESLSAIRGRLLEGGQVWLIGSPYNSFGPIYDMDAERFGKPAGDLVIARAPGPAMNPTWWTPQRCAEMERTDPKQHRVDVLAMFADPEESLFSSLEVERQTREEEGPLPPDPEVNYVATMDPATRGNAWTLTIVGCYGLGGPGGTWPTYRVALARQWIGSRSKPLSPSRVLEEIAELVTPYGVTDLHSDQWAQDAIRDLAEQKGLMLLPTTIDASNRLRMAEKLARFVSMGLFELPKDPVLRGDLLTAKKRVTVNGMTLVLPQSGGGRHCDYLPPLMLAVEHPPDPPELPEPSVDDEFEALLTKTMGNNDTETEWEGVIRQFIS